MTDHLEAELREAFALRAAQVSPDAVERLRRAAYRPRMRRRWPLTMSAVGAASGTAAVVSVVVLGGSQTAFGGWSATPKTLTADQSAATQTNCQANLPAALSQGPWNQVATDTRGPYTVVVYQSGSSLASCFMGPSFTTVQAESLESAKGGVMVSASGVSPPAGASSSVGGLVAGGDIEQLLVSHFSQAGNGPYTLAEGHLEPTVSAVTLVLSDGQDVTATTGSGWLVAWWPGSADVTAARVTSASGTTTEQLNHLRLPTPPPPSSGAPGSGAAVPLSPGPDDLPG
jgi:hypothetical protein